MRPRETRAASASVDALFAEVARAGEDLAGLRELLLQRAPEETLLLDLLRRPVPVRLLELVATTAPWSERRRVLGVVALNPRTPRALALRLVPELFWHDLADVAASPRLAMALRVRAEAELKEMLPEMRLGERVTLGRLATPAILPLLLEDGEPRVTEAALANPRLREDDLLRVLRRETVPVCLLEAAAGSHRWLEHYQVRLGLVLQPRTPLPLALAQLSSLLPRDLRRTAQTSGLAPLVRIAAERLALGRAEA